MQIEGFKKVLFKGMALSAFSFTVVSPAFAAEVANSANTSANVTLTAEGDIDEDRPSVVDPDEVIPPGGEDGDGEITNPGNKGRLTIDYVPNLSFGINELSAKTATYQSTNSKAYAQVSDIRGNGDGWSLKVAATPFTDEEGEKELKGAYITLPKGSTQTNGKGLAPSTYEVNLTETSSPIMVASQGEGMGSWADVFDVEEVKLHVPAGNYVGEYTAELTWTLENAPQ